MDINFEEYSVDTTRAGEIRNFVESLKTESWVADLSTLVTELKDEKADSSEAAPTLPGLLDEVTTASFSPPVGHAAADIVVKLQSADMKVFLGNELLIELSFLPKANDFAVFFVNEEKFEIFKEKMAALADQIKLAKQSKTNRSAAFKSRFNN